MQQFVLLLHCWNPYNVQHKSGSLSKETYLAFIHTVGTFVILIREMLQRNVLKSILTSKFQTDQLESRLGSYRQLSGSNYLVTVTRLLKLYSMNNIVFLMEYKLLPGIKEYINTYFYDYIHYSTIVECTLLHTPLVLVRAILFYLPDLLNKEA